MTDNKDKCNISDCISEATIHEMIEQADAARKHSYAPHSGFRVGAALLVAKDNKISGSDIRNYRIVTGCNIENAAYSPGNCAERTAVFKAVSDGDRNFDAIAIVAGKDDMSAEYTSPCGVCRQVLREFVDPKKFYVIMAKSKEDYIIKTLEELLPMSFGPENLQ